MSKCAVMKWQVLFKNMKAGNSLAPFLMMRRYAAESWPKISCLLTYKHSGRMPLLWQQADLESFSENQRTQSSTPDLLRRLSISRVRHMQTENSFKFTRQ